MWDLTKKQLIYIGFYYFWIVFLLACVAFDMAFDNVSGFTFGYAFALIYFIIRTREVHKELEIFNAYESED